MIEVVSAVILRVDASASGRMVPRILLTQRMPPRDYAFCFECPGGKVGEGEDPQRALRRELLEELGIDPLRVEVNPPVWSGAFGTPSGKIHLTFYRVTEYVGTPTPREGQGIGWFTLDDLDRLDLTPGNVAAHGAIARVMQEAGR